MSDRLFRSEAELKKALAKDLKDLRTMQKRGDDIKGIEQVISHKKKMLKFETWK